MVKKFESITNGLTDGRTDRLTWVGARDAGASKNNWGPLSSTFHVGQPETLTDWKSESVTDQRTDLLG